MDRERVSSRKETSEKTIVTIQAREVKSLIWGFDICISNDVGEENQCKIYLEDKLYRTK